jgi:hypothetical protein
VNLILDVPGDFTGTQVASTFQLIVGSAAPFAIIVTCNIIIIVTVKGASKARAAMVKSDSASDQKGTAHLTKMLISVSGAYLLTSLPYRLFFVSLVIPQVAAQFDNSKNTCDFMLYNVIVATLFYWWCFNFSVNFYTYCLGGGRKYRQDIKELLANMCRRNAKCASV